MSIAIPLIVGLVILYGILMFIQHECRQMMHDLNNLHPPKPRWYRYFNLWDPPP